MRLNVGSGDHPAAAPWVNLDSFEGLAPDVVGDARDLPFDDESADAIYAGHLLEHLSLDEGVPQALGEFRRVLRPGGRLCVVGPCYERGLATGDDVLVGLIETGGCRWEGDRHLWLSTGSAALAAIRQTFPAAVEIDAMTLGVEWPVAALVSWQFAVTAFKEE